MAKKTLLEAVKSIMSDMDSDEISSITDTVESMQVVSILHDIYDQMLANDTIPEVRELGQLELCSPTKNTYLKIPDTVQEVLEIKYDIQTVDDPVAKFRTIKYLSVTDFLDTINQFRSDDTGTEVVTDPNTGISLRFRKDRAPVYWTSFDDQYIAFDSYDAAVDTTGLLNTKTQCFVSTYPTWTDDDNFVPDMDENLFPYWIAEAKSTCFVNLKQQANAKLEQQAKRQRIKFQHGKFRTAKAEEDSLASAQPNFGRR